jgi:hypothetical protein
MIFLYFASDSFASRAQVLVDSIKKYHPYDQIVHVNPGQGTLGSYVPGMAKARLQKALELLQDSLEDVVIIGADCELFANINHLVYQNDADVILTPHIKSPIENRDYMAQIYNTGHANADFIFFRNTHYHSEKILKWLISVTEDGHTPGAFYEQTWLSSLPFLFDNIDIIGDPGFNVGYWDINHVKLEKQNDKYLVNGVPLVMVQYSGYMKGLPERMSRYSRELCNNPLALEIYQEYDRRITE